MVAEVYLPEKDRRRKKATVFPPFFGDLDTVGADVLTGLCFADWLFQAIYLKGMVGYTYIQQQ